MRCPKCRALTLVPPGVAGDGGHLVRCPRCTATWISRPGDEPVHATAGRAPVVRKPPLTIEASVAPAARQRPRGLRAGLFAVAAMLALALGAVVTLVPVVSAGPEATRLEAGR